MREMDDAQFARLQGFVLAACGIALLPQKKALVHARLDGRLRERGLRSYADYLDLLESRADPAEAQCAVEKLTTGETYFFREPAHFELLRELALQASARRQPLSVWSAACASGEEAYSIAMVLADVQADLPWQLLASDLNSAALAQALRGHYAEGRCGQIPEPYRRRFCLKGQGAQAGTLLVARELRERLRFEQINLDRTLPLAPASFDLIFLRNVLIYFGPATRVRVLSRLPSLLRPGGHLLIGHAETLHGCDSGIRHLLQTLRPSVFRLRSGAGEGGGQT